MRALRATTCAILLGLTACGSSPATPSNVASAAARESATPSSEVSAFPTAEPTVQPTPTPPTATDATFSLLPSDAPDGELPQITCQGDIGPSDQVAIVELRSRGAFGPVVLRDYGDPAHPITVCEFGRHSNWTYSLLDARHVLAQVIGCDKSSCASAVIDVPAVQYHWFALPDTDDTFESLVGISPGLDEVAWRSATYADPAEGQRRSIYVTRSNGTRLIGHLPATPGGFCGGPHFFSGYSASGDYLFLLDYETGAPIFRIYHGRQRVFSAQAKPSGFANVPAVPLWAPRGDTLYYVRGGDAWQWTPDGGAQPFIRGYTWGSVTISPDGRYLAFARWDAKKHIDDTYLVDLTASAEPSLIARRRDAPRFLTDTQLWLQPEPASGGCVGLAPPPPAIYDINEDAESPSIIRRVWSTWPAR